MCRRKTLLLSDSIDDIQKAAALLRTGELVAIPTETVYGLAADAENGTAVARIFEAKGRPADNPLIVHIADWNMLSGLVSAVPETAEKLARAFWPGPLTMIFFKGPRVPDEVSAGLSTVAVRMPSHPVARSLIRESGCPLAAPSANLSGSPSPTTAAHVLADLDGRIAAVVDGGTCAVGVESTVLLMTEDSPRLLRSGGVTVDMLERVAGHIEIDPAVTHMLADGETAASPGMKYKHYAPKTQVILVKGTPEAYVDYVNSRIDEGIAALCFDEDRPKLRVPCIAYGSRRDPASQTKRIFEALRELDCLGYRIAYAACPEEDGIGLAVYNRLLRAAGFEVVEP